MSRKLSCAQLNHVETDIVFSTLQPLRSRRVADPESGAERAQLASFDRMFGAQTAFQQANPHPGRSKVDLLDAHINQL